MQRAAPAQERLLARALLGAAGAVSISVSAARGRSCHAVSISLKAARRALPSISRARPGEPAAEPRGAKRGGGIGARRAIRTCSASRPKLVAKQCSDLRGLPSCQ